MAIPTNRQEFINYCLRKLGEPVIKVNVAVEQVDDRVTDALYRFYERHYEGVEPVWIYHTISDPVKILDSNGEEILDSNGEPLYTTNTDTEKGYISLPNDIIGVVNVLRPIYILSAHRIEYQAFVHELHTMAHSVSFGNLSYYYTAQMNMSLLNRLFNADPTYSYNSITNKLIVAGGLKNSKNAAGGLIIQAFRKIHGETLLSNPTGTSIHNIWKNNWLQRYATALIKEQWAQNLSKYQSVQLLGGVQMNGNEMMAQAKDEIAKLEEELQQTYEEPPGFFMG
jgi:hypothetical protein